MAFKLATLFVDITARTASFTASTYMIRRDLARLGIEAAGSLVSTVGSASALHETMNKVAVVFGTSAGVVTKSIDAMANRFGIVRTQALDAASSIGLIGQAAGMTDPQAAALGVHFTKLAADVASFYDIPVEKALDKIRSGLVGQVRPLRELGVLLSAAAVKQEAYNQGLYSGKGQLDEQTKVKMRAILITRDLAKATGDLERTEGSYANQTRQLEGRLENMAAVTGNTLMPAFNDMKHLLNDVVAHFNAGYGVMHTILDEFASYFQTFIAGLGSLYNNWDAYMKITEISAAEMFVNMEAIIENFRGNATRIFEWIGNNWKAVILDTFNAIATIISNKATFIGETLDELAHTILTLGQHEFKLPVMKGMLEGFEKTMQDLPKLQALPAMADFGKMKQEIEDEIARKDLARANKKVFGNRPGGVLGPEGGEDREKAGKDKKLTITDPLEWARRIQEAQLNKDDSAKETAKNTAKTAEILQKLSEKLIAQAVVGGLFGNPFAIAAPG